MGGNKGAVGLVYHSSRFRKSHLLESDKQRNVDDVNIEIQPKETF